MTILQTPGRRESAFIAGVTLVGAVLRFWNPQRLGLNHFDEGIYALAGLWSLSPKGLAGISPELIAYAPPLYSILVGIAYLLSGGPSDLAAIFVSQVAGVATIPIVGWLGWRTFGPGAGAMAASLAALSGPHIVFSRMALTDSTFLLTWALALVLGSRFLEKPGAIRAIVFGASVGLAQNAKYNGVLAGVIVAASAVWGLVRPTSGGRRQSLRAVGFGVLAALVAAAVYWPWYRFVEAQPGGYAALTRHHRGYLDGPGSWPGHLKAQIDQAVILSGSLWGSISWGAVAWPVAWIGFAVGRSSALGWRRFRLGLMVGCLALGLLPELSLWSGLALAPWLLLSDRPGPRLVAIGWLLMAALSPFYHPYARLMLPLHLLGWLNVAAMATQFLGEPTVILRPRLGPFAAAMTAVLGLAVWLHGPILSDHDGPSRELLAPTDSLRSAVRELSAKFPTGAGIPGLVRPPELFYAASNGLAIRRMPDLSALLNVPGPPGPRIIDRVQLDQESDGLQALKRLSPAFQVREVFSYRLSPATRLDLGPGWRGQDHGQGFESSALLLLQPPVSGTFGQAPGSRTFRDPPAGLD